tara:strand:- start:25554 stop:27641 length:2088 start_codon:yes stop_codon:yes gene_type:complete
MSLRSLYLFILPFAVLLSTPTYSANRTVAVLWDSEESDARSYTYSLVHRKLEVLLNHYGLMAKYFDINEEDFKKSDIAPEKFYALISWFSDDETKNVKEVRAAYRDWFKSKKKVLTLGQMGIFYDEKQETYDLADINNTLKIVGLEYEDHQYETPLGLKVQILTDRKNVEFERSFKFEIPAVKVFKSIDDKNDVLVNIEDTINNKISPVVLRNDQFFMVHAGLDLFFNPLLKYTQWRINPFLLMEWLVGDTNQPKPDTTTINGKRIYYGHVDGDAFINISDIDRTSISGKILLDQVIEKYKLPTTISFVIAELDLKHLGKPSYQNIAKEIASKDYVELASHTYYHPLSWAVAPSQYDIDAYLDDPSKYKGGPILAYQPKDKMLSYEREIKGSLDFINEKIAPKGKESKFVLWSGSCEPPEEALEVINKHGLINMNGGDSRFDKDFPSYSHLLPLYRQVGSMTQFYSSNTNEIPYTFNWTGPFSGFSKVIDTFKNTDSPHRIKPINIYYHFYSAEKRSSLIALDAVYKWVSEQDHFPIFTSHYPSIIQGFQSTQITKMADASYILKNYGELRTFRVDHQNLSPDYEKSKNIIGHRLINDSLYLFLGEAPVSQLYLTKNKVKSTYLRWSDYSLSKFNVKVSGIEIAGKSLLHKQINIYVADKIFEPHPLVESFNYSDGFATILFKETNISLSLDYKK